MPLGMLFAPGLGLYLGQSVDIAVTGPVRTGEGGESASGSAARGEEKAAGGTYGGDVVYQGEQQYPRVHELNPSAAYVEADGGWGSRKRITPVELPQSPGRF